MLVLALAALLSAAPPALEAWSARACPPPRAEPDSNVALKFMEQQRAECLRKAMNKVLDRVILPLKKSKPAAYKEWMDLQAEYNRWMRESCAAVEEANWVELSTGERSMGTGYGFSESQCLQRHYAWRGFYVESWFRAERNPLEQVLQELARPGGEARQSWRAYRDQVRQAAARAPAQVADPSLPARKLSRDDWKLYEERLERALAGPRALAERQCGLAAAPAAGDCVQRFADSLFAQLELPQPPSPSEGGP
jgi:hypothetical protein